MEKILSYFCSTLITAVILLVSSNALAELNLFNDISQSTEPEVVQEVDASSLSPLETVDVGSILKVRESSNDIYFLWNSDVVEENGFNTITITYPSGTSPKMYFFQVEISTILF